MNFDYTYILCFGRQVFEPMVLLTNFILFLVSVYCFKRLIKYRSAYPSEMASFILILGISSCFGAVAHAVHYQLGTGFFQVVFFSCNMLNLISIYFFFKGSYTYFNLQREKVANKKVLGFVIAWIMLLLIVEAVQNEFLLIKIHAAIVLIYGLTVHFLAFLKKDRGSGTVVLGIVISFLSILVHSLKFSVDEWFNYKDIAHTIMIISMIVIYRGIKLNSDRLIRSGKEV